MRMYSKNGISGAEKPTRHTYMSYMSTDHRPHVLLLERLLGKPNS